MEKQDKIIQMFNEIAPTYDKANRAMSLGVDTSWRKNACKLVLQNLLEDDIDIVDVACGTGDMMGIWIETANKFNKTIKSLTGVDPSSGMLEVAKKKFPNFDFIQAKADEISLKDDFAKIISISYGIRNVQNLDGALKEFNRILKIGGYLVVLEFTKHQKSGFISKARDWYLKNIVPKIGAFISKNKPAYEYLPESIDNFLDSKTFEKKLVDNGFEIVTTKGYSFDVSTLFIAKKIR